MVNHRIDRTQVFMRWKNGKSGIVCCYERENCFPCQMIKLIELVG